MGNGAIYDLWLHSGRLKEGKQRLWICVWMYQAAFGSLAPFRESCLAIQKTHTKPPLQKKGPNKEASTQKVQRNMSPKLGISQLFKKKERRPQRTVTRNRSRFLSWNPVRSIHTTSPQPRSLDTGGSVFSTRSSKRDPWHSLPAPCRPFVGGWGGGPAPSLSAPALSSETQCH